MASVNQKLDLILKLLEQQGEKVDSIQRTVETIDAKIGEPEAPAGFSMTFEPKE